MPKYPETLLYLMKKNYISAAQLARDVNISQAAIVKYQEGRIPATHILIDIAKRFNTTVEYLVNGAGEEPAPVNPVSPRSERQMFAIRLAELMEAKSITASELAKQMNLSRAQVSNWLRAKNYPGSDALTKLAVALGVSKSKLIAGYEFEMKELVFLEATKAAIGANDKGLKTEIKVMCEELAGNDDLAREMIEFYKFQKAKKKKEDSK